MSDSKNNKYEELFDACKSYIKDGYDLLRLELLDKLSLILGLIVLIFAALFLCFGALSFFSVALIGVMTKAMPLSVACCILGGVLLLVALILYLLREQVFINPFIKLLSGIFFSDKQKKEEEQSAAQPAEAQIIDVKEQEG